MDDRLDRLRRRRQRVDECPPPPDRVEHLERSAVDGIRSRRESGIDLGGAGVPEVEGHLTDRDVVVNEGEVDRAAREIARSQGLEIGRIVGFEPKLPERDRDVVQP